MIRYTKLVQKISDVTLSSPQYNNIVSRQFRAQDIEAVSEMSEDTRETN
jgi:hypothetical protein